MTRPAWLREWSRNSSYLFIIEGEITIFAPCIGVSTVAWEPQKRPWALLYGCPSIAPHLVSLASGFDLEIHHFPCGRPDVYEEENAIIKLHACSVRRHYFNDPVNCDSPSSKAVNLYVLVEAEEIEILPENG